MKTTIFKAARLSIILLATSFALPSFAWVQSVSLERTFVGKNIRLLEVEVNCKFYNKARRLRKVVSENKPWCSVDLPSMCATRKIVLAREVCDFNPEEFDALIAAEKAGTKPAPALAKSAEKIKASETAANANSSENLLQEQMVVEEQRIKLEQRRLELRKKEIALKKQLSDLANL